MPREIKAAGDVPAVLRITGSSGPLELQAAEAGADGQPAKLRKFGMIAYTGDALRLAWFASPVVVDLAGAKAGRQDMPILRGHDPERIVGHTNAVEISAKQIKASGVISGVGEAANEVLATADNGFPWQASIGASIDRLEFLEAGEKAKVNGRSFVGPLYVVRASTVSEISFVPMGADGATSATVAAGSRGGSVMNLEQWLAAKGLTLTAENTAALTAQFEAENKPKPTPTPAPVAPVVQAQVPVAQPVPVLPSPDEHIARMRAAHAAELERHQAISRICAENPSLQIDVSGQRVTLFAHAVAQGWSAEKTELEFLRANRPNPAIISRSHDRDCSLEAMQGAMLLRCGGRLDHPAYRSREALAMGVSPWLRAGLNDADRNRVMELAHRYADMSMVDVCREAIRISGRSVPHGTKELIRAAFSGGALTQIFTDSVNARIVATYMEAGDTTQGWTQEVDVADFKQNKDISLVKGAGLAKLPRGGTADHESRSDEYETYQIARYAKQFVVDEQDIIDDSMNAMAEFPVEMGMEAARLRPDLVYSIILDNPSLTATGRDLFNSTDDNVDTGSALAAATLRTGIANMNVKRQNGVNLNLNPTHLIVPSTLRFLARELTQSAGIIIAAGNAGAAQERGTLNTLQGEGLTVVSDARLENGLTDPATGTALSGSASTWYLACALARTILVAYLRGTGRAPQTQNWTLSEGQWGMGWSIAMDIGAKARDFRGMYRATA